MTTTNLTDDIVARAFEAGLRERMRWADGQDGLKILTLGNVILGDVWKNSFECDGQWMADPIANTDDSHLLVYGPHPTRESAQAALIDAAVAAIMGGG